MLDQVAVNNIKHQKALDVAAEFERQGGEIQKLSIIQRDIDSVKIKTRKEIQTDDYNQT